MTRAGVVLAVLCAARGICAQALAPSPDPLAFEVASIKRNTTNRFMPGPAGGITAGLYWVSNASAADMILRGYPVNRPQDMLNLPEWATSERYDVLAKGKPRATPDEQRQMWRALIADRMNVLAHYETRSQRGYNLVVARPDRRLGPQMQLSTLDCTRPQPEVSAQTIREARGVEGFAMQRCGLMGVGTHGGTARTASGGVNTGSLAGYLSGVVTLPVADRTNLEGYYSVQISYALQRTGTAPPATDAPSVFVAVQEQLGLKLEPATVNVPVLVVDRAERPTPD